MTNSTDVPSPFDTSTQQHGPRRDLAEAVAATPPGIQRDLQGPCREAFAFVERYLPESERVLAVSSAAVRGFDAPTNSVLVLTDRRVVFVAPKPQVVSCPLVTISGVSTMDNVFFLKADGDYQLGADPSWGATFADIVTRMIAQAKITQL